jgi:hypothetical protein
VPRNDEAPRSLAGLRVSFAADQESVPTERASVKEQATMAAAQVIERSSEQDPLELMSDEIDVEDARALRTFFRHSGMGVFTRSTMGPMLDRAEMFGRRAIPCRKCGGDRTRNVGGTGWALRKRPRVKLATAIEIAIARWTKRGGVYRHELFADEPCRKCGGSGWVAAGRKRVKDRDITARPMGSSMDDAGGVGVSDIGLLQLASTSKRLDLVTRASPGSFDALEAWFGPDVEGLTGLWDMTPAGRTLLRRNSTGLDPVRFFENQRLDQEQHRDAGRAATFDAADEQAQAILTRAFRIYNWAGLLLLGPSDAS